MLYVKQPTKEVEMKKFIIGMSVLLILFGASNAFAGQPLVGLVWGTNLSMYDNGSVVYADELVLDIGTTPGFYTANGIFNLASGGAITCVGTGYLAVNNEVVFGLQCDSTTVDVVVDYNTLNGTITTDSGGSSFLSYRRMY
jgi:hypothetical protein